MWCGDENSHPPRPQIADSGQCIVYQRRVSNLSISNKSILHLLSILIYHSFQNWRWNEKKNESKLGGKYNSKFMGRILLWPISLVNNKFIYLEGGWNILILDLRRGGRNSFNTMSRVAFFILGHDVYGDREWFDRKKHEYTYIAYCYRKCI